MTSAGARKPLPARSLVEFPAYSFIPTAMDKIAHFGYKQVAESEKAAKVAEVFHSVAAQYDVMNDLMSAGLHRLWKRFAVAQAGLRPGMKVLDVAGGTADLTRLFLKEVGETGTVLLTDINFSMLREGRDRMLNEGKTPPTVQCDGERLPFPSNHFDCVSVAFGLRNMTHKDQALAEMHRVLKPGGRLQHPDASKRMAGQVGQCLTQGLRTIGQHLLGLLDRRRPVCTRGRKRSRP